MQPRRQDISKLSSNPAFEDKVRNVVGVYLLAVHPILNKAAIHKAKIIGGWLR